MAQIHRQMRQSRVRIDAGFLPVAESVDGKRMTERMQRGPPLPRRRHDAEPTELPLEGAVQGVKIEGASLL